MGLLALTPYFKNSSLVSLEAMPGAERMAHSNLNEDLLSELLDALFRASESAGYSLTTDVNGYRQEGFAAFDRNIDHGRRLSAARAICTPHCIARTSSSYSCRERTDHRQAAWRGARFAEKPAEARSSGSTGRTIIAAGAINTPKLLQLSGIGPRPVLEAAGVPVIHDLPGVGENLQDHLEVYIQHSSLKPITQQPNLQNGGDRDWTSMVTPAGSATTNHFEAGGFVRSRSDLTYPNVMIHFLPLAVRYDGTVAETLTAFKFMLAPCMQRQEGPYILKERIQVESHRSPLITWELRKTGWTGLRR